jgi:hypothetical protein
MVGENCICLKNPDGSIAMKVVGCLEHGSTSQQIQEIVDELMHKAGCTCSRCSRPKEKK